jgi:hypothetical protein
MDHHTIRDTGGWIAARLPMIENNSSLQATTSPPAMFHPDSLVTLLAGPEEHRMVVHETYLSQDSAFFKAALKKQWTEGQTRVIKLPEESLEPMQHYIDHVYSGRVPTHNLTAEKMSDVDGHYYESLVHLYVLAERMLDANCRNAIIREIFRLSQLECGSPKAKTYPDSQAITVIYQGTTSESPARRLMIDFAVCCGDETWFDGEDGQEYLLDFSKAMVKKLRVHKSVSEFRFVTLKAEDYFVSEEA